MVSIFADSSVMIAGVGSTIGASRAVLILADIGFFQLVISPLVLEESRRNIAKKLPASMPVFTEFLVTIKPEVVPSPSVEECQRWNAIIEAKDAPIIAAAISAKVNRLLTLNTKDFTPEVAAITGLIIQTPGDFIQEIRGIITEGLR
ncbi:MAG: PIN domain-containing protein [Cyanobacteriota bacterium]|nr:PIN domain-containing protein [Cyanobacteriota bacterium]